MKKAAVLLTVTAFLLAGALMHSCKKDAVQDVKTSINPELKAEPLDYYDIMMDQETDLGDVIINFTCPDLTITADFDEAVLEVPEEYRIMIEESHLYVGDAIPPYGPGKFTVPEGWVDDDPEPWAWSFALDECEECLESPGYYSYDFGYYFALHFQLIKEYWVIVEYAYNEATGLFDIPVYGWGAPEGETAWMLDYIGGSGANWTKPNGAVQGWGKYYDIDFFEECPPLP